MAFYQGNVQVQTTPTLIVQVSQTARYTAVTIQNNHTTTIYVGDKSVATSGATLGHLILAGQSYQIWLNAGDKVYAISAAQTAAGAISVNYSA
jgi:uncharacterized protein with beta-barrel porin domain